MLDIFTSFDKDGSGQMDADEMGDLLAELGCGWLARDRAELEFLVRTMDLDNSGEIDFDEFWEW